MDPTVRAVEIRKINPLVVHITNLVTINDCANATICAGGSPVMTDTLSDAVDLAMISSAIVLNIGTVNERTLEIMLAAGKEANAHDVPIIFDPVGAGASKIRNKASEKILSSLEISILKGNAGEIGFLSGVGGKVRGVDSIGSSSPMDAVVEASEKYGCIVASTGPTDYVAFHNDVTSISRGHPLMDKVSGTGCMSTSVIAVYAGAIGATTNAVKDALTVFSIAGEKASVLSNGPGTFKNHLLDALYSITMK